MFNGEKESVKLSPRNEEKIKWINVDKHTLIKLGLLACLGVILIVAGRLARDVPVKNDQGTVPPTETLAAENIVSKNNLTYQQLLEQQLTATLSEIRGVGDVLVQLNLEGGSQHSVATNTQEEVRLVEETTTAGTGRVSEERKIESQVVIAREGSVERPIVVDEFFPKVRGVLVVAEGAANPTIKEELSQAVQVLLGLPAHKVKVMERKG